MNKVQQKRKPKIRSGLVMLATVGCMYLLTFYFNPQAAQDALFAAFKILKMIIPILLVVFFLMALLHTFIDSKSISRHIGEQSGIRGWTIALVGGILSHGPAYVWYPMISDLRKGGAKDGLIVAFFYTRSIKLPWLPLMVSYFGLAFTVVLTFLVIVSAWIQGLIMNKYSR
jgi:uncharacterized membrane protein YraQ (UPF0718 family)